MCQQKLQMENRNVKMISLHQKGEEALSISQNMEAEEEKKEPPARPQKLTC